MLRYIFPYNNFLHVVFSHHSLIFTFDFVTLHMQAMYFFFPRRDNVITLTYSSCGFIIYLIFLTPAKDFIIYTCSFSRCRSCSFIFHPMTCLFYPVGFHFHIFPPQDVSHVIFLYTFTCRQVFMFMLNIGHVVL